MSCISPRNPDDEKPPQGESEKTSNQAPLQAARRGLLKAVWEASFANRFSSRPIDMEDYFSRESFANSTMFSSLATESTDENDKEVDGRRSMIETKNLTTSEQHFLENLLQSEDLDSIRRASERLSDKAVFPLLPDPKLDALESKTSPPVLKRRESGVQQDLFRLHQSATVKPSTVLRRMTIQEKLKAGASIAKFATASTPLIPPLQQSNSILTAQSLGESLQIPVVPSTNSVDDDTEETGGSWDMNSEDGRLDKSKPPLPRSSSSRRAARPKKLDSSNWNPFGDVNSWIDGNQGVEVDRSGVPLGNKELPSPTSNPFRILGTSAEDISAHPHVLTPPLMEGLQEFMPESLHEYHFWLKYSLVRDGSSPYPGHPPLIDLLRQCRASEYTVLAIETTSGHVFGSFCSQPWRLQGDTYWGTEDSFVWKMRRSRNERCDSIVEQVLMESKIDVFPFTGQNSKVQRCSSEIGMILGEGELSEMSAKGDHFGHAIRLPPSLLEAWTSTCETFGSPCLVPSDLRGERVEIANVELWALTPHQSIELAVNAEMRQLFLAANRSPKEKTLNLFEILVSGPL